MKNIIFIALMAFIYSNPIMAQNNRQEKRLLKSLKKEYGLNDAYFKRSWRDNYAYIVLWTKDGDSMIVLSQTPFLHRKNIHLLNMYQNVRKATNVVDIITQQRIAILLAIKGVLSQKTIVVLIFS